MNTKSIEINKSVADVLGELLRYHKMSPAKLGAAIGFPRATIGKITAGKTTDPRISTLEAIANYFNISLDQLLGNQPLTETHTNISTISPVPIISWQEAKNWTSIQKDKLEIVEKISIDMEQNSVTPSPFALKVCSDAMWPQFQEDSILVIDSERTVKNRDFVIAYINKHKETIFRQLYVEGSRKILKAINKDFPIIQMQEDDKILGVIIKTINQYV